MGGITFPTLFDSLLNLLLTFFHHFSLDEGIKLLQRIPLPIVHDLKPPVLRYLVIFPIKKMAKLVTKVYVFRSQLLYLRL